MKAYKGNAQGAGVLLAQMFDQLAEDDQRNCAEILHDRIKKHVKKDDNTTEQIVKISDVAKRLGRTTRTVHNLVEQGLLESVMPPGRSRCWGISETSLREFMDRSCGTTEQQQGGCDE